MIQQLFFNNILGLKLEFQKTCPITLREMTIIAVKVTFQANLEIVTCEFYTKSLLGKKSQKGPKFRMQLLKWLNLCTELYFCEFLTFNTEYPYFENKVLFS